LNWGIPEEPEIEVTDIFSAFDKILYGWDAGIIQTPEARAQLNGLIKMLIDMGWPLEELAELPQRKTVGPAGIISAEGIATKGDVVLIWRESKKKAKKHVKKK